MKYQELAEALKRKLPAKAQWCAVGAVLIRETIQALENAEKSCGSASPGREKGWGPWHPGEVHPGDMEAVLAIVTGSHKSQKFEGAYLLAQWNHFDGWVLEMLPEWVDPPVVKWCRMPEAEE